MERESLPEVDVISESFDGQLGEDLASPEPLSRTAVLALLGLLVVAIAVSSAALGSGRPTEAGEAGEALDDRSLDRSGENAGLDASAMAARREAVLLAATLPRSLLAAELFAAAPGRDTAVALLEAIGGRDALVLGAAEGAFDLVTFDPARPEVLLASQRSTYGAADNSDRNERWLVSAEGVSQALFAPDRPHDVVQFTSDGDVAMWSNSGNSTGFASRLVSVERGPASWTSAPMYASRSVIAGGTVFALTGNADYYSPNLAFESFVADDGATQVVLDVGAGWARVDSPEPGIVVTYPRDEDGSTVVWDASSLRRLPTHGLAGRAYKAIALSGDSQVAVGVTFRGELEVFDPSTRATKGVFGDMNPDSVLQPVTLNADGTMAITVDRDGTVMLRWVGDPRPVAVLDGIAGPARVSPEHRAPYTASAVEPQGRRVAVKIGAAPGRQQRWEILDTDLNSWLVRACRVAGRSLSADERSTLDLAPAPVGCPLGG